MPPLVGVMLDTERVVPELVGKAGCLQHTAGITCFRCQGVTELHQSSISVQRSGFHTSMTTETYSVQTIRDYLLGQLPESETERLDELSITDDECAERIRAVEHDLVDAFARGELQGVVLEQFRSRYLTTPRRREATRFAEALQSLDENSGRRQFVRGGSRADDARSRDSGAGANCWPLAAAVVMLATASVWLVLDNRMLRERVTSAESSRRLSAIANSARPRPGGRQTPPRRRTAGSRLR